MGRRRTVEVGLTPKTDDDLVELTTCTALSEDVAINHAIVLYAHIAARLAQGDVLLMRTPDGRQDRINMHFAHPGGTTDG